ncbi:phytanoyl-CoA dioxygenase family protein [Streptomyces sp. NPDC001674]|uniref:phytanoyl-CoA dioxygenase family protein n=1 Tax=Streptomyces sp. NPDC001674 TaxID=3154394 RepID=UPI00331B70CE
MPTPDRYQYRAASRTPYFSADGETYFTPSPLRHLRKSRPLRVLSEADFAFWQAHGYTVVRQAVSAAAARRLLSFAWRFQGMDPSRPDTWYRERPYRSQLDRDLHVFGFVEAYHHPLLWDTRQTRRVYDAFVDVWDCEELWVSLDRLNLNPPNTGNRHRDLATPPDEGFDIELHWDVDTTLPVPPQRVQGILALTDTAEDTGGFQCAPELFRVFDRWRADRPLGHDPFRPGTDRAAFPVVRPELRAGDLLIFNGLLPHGVAANTSRDGVRAVQYLSMMPALPDHEQLRRSRVESWRTLSTPDWNPTLLGDALRPEARRYGPAPLTGLGERLLGLSLWPTAPHDTEARSARREPACAASA